MNKINSRFPVPDFDSWPDDMRKRIDNVEEKAGFVPDVFRVLVHQPDEFCAFLRITMR